MTHKAIFLLYPNIQVHNKFALPLTLQLYGKTIILEISYKVSNLRTIQGEFHNVKFVLGHGQHSSASFPPFLFLVLLKTLSTPPGLVCMIHQSHFIPNDQNHLLLPFMPSFNFCTLQYCLYSSSTLPSFREQPVNIKIQKEHTLSKGQEYLYTICTQMAYTSFGIL